MNNSAMYNLSYGLFVLTASEGEKDNGCIINTASQVTTSPNRITIAVNKQNYTHEMIMNTGKFNVSILSENAVFDQFKRFGFQSGRSVDKFSGYTGAVRGKNSILYITENTNAYISAKLIHSVDMGTHTIFIADVTDCDVLSDVPSVTYTYYQKNIKPKPEKTEKKGFRCKVCGYVYEGDTLPDDFICPICKHGAEDFERI